MADFVRGQFMTGNEVAYLAVSDPQDQSGLRGRYERVIESFLNGWNGRFCVLHTVSRFFALRRLLVPIIPLVPLTKLALSPRIRFKRVTRFADFSLDSRLATLLQHAAGILATLSSSPLAIGVRSFCAARNPLRA